MASAAPAITADALRKRYPGSAELALDGFDLFVPRGTVHGLLGPNGAGKTTAVRILATLLRADSGRAEIDGLDVATQAPAVRTRIGLVGQFAALDEILDGLAQPRPVRAAVPPVRPAGPPPGRRAARAVRPRRHR